MAVAVLASIGSNPLWLRKSDDQLASYEPQGAAGDLFYTGFKPERDLLYVYSQTDTTFDYPV